MAKLSDPVTMLKGVGEVRAKQLAQLNIFTLRDLICHFPRGYEDRTKLVPIEKLEPDVPACFRAMVMNTPRTSHIRKGLDLTKVQVADTTGRLNVTFFNNRFAAQQLEYGREYIFYGAVSGDFIGYSMTNPVFEAPESQPVTTRRILPIYPLTAGLTNAALLRLVQQALAVCDLPEEILPAEVREKYGILPAERAYFAIHEPNSMAEAELAKKRMIFEEFFVFSAGLALMRAARKEKKTEPYTDFGMAPFYDSLSFTLTGAQSRAVGEILEDFRRGVPMNRLVQGDVGSGKTAVAEAAMYKAVRGGCQAVMMAPTEILAEQHCKTLTAMLSPFGINVALLAGKLTAAQKRSAKAGLESGGIQVAVGTSALIQGDVVFNRLGLAVTDEQHRFGVLQRADLISKAQNGSPHTLVMSATPIPRTLSLILYGDLDISVIDELPPGRKPVETFALDETYRPRVNRFIEKEISSGGRVYVICPLVEENESLDRKSAEEHLKTLEKAFPNRRVALLHGKMPGKKKQEIMTAFKEGSVDILISTTVVEVGVDVPEASLMIVENAECFGLSGLHQLRGRIGRGKRKSYCILMYDKQTPQSRERLETMCRTSNGFEIAEADLKLRGPGDFFGSRQSGGPVFRTADAADMATVVQTRAVCDEISKKLSEEQYKPLYLEAKKLLDSAVGGNTIN
mgnify:CR=1 FL=1